MQIKFTKILAVSFCIPILFFSSCSKKEPEQTNPETPTYYLADSLRSLMFKQGSYWVYENDSTHVLDSVSVISTERSFFHQTVFHSNGWYVEYYKINLHDFNDTLDYYDYLSNNSIRRNSGGESCGGQPVFYLIGPYGCGGCGLYYLGTFSSLVINSNTFNDVREFKIKASEQCWHTFEYDTYYYYKYGIGVVRKQVDDGSGNIATWSLKRWNVIL